MRRSRPRFVAMRRISKAGLHLLAALVCGLPAPAQDVDNNWKNLLLQGQYATNSGDFSRAEQMLQRALREAEHFGPDGPRVAATLRSLGQAYLAAKRFADAESAFRRALVIMDKGDVETNADFADLNVNLAISLTELGKHAEALPLLSRSLAIYAKQTGGQGPRTAQAHCMTGDAYRAMESWQAAEAPLKRCAEIREEDGGVLNPDLADALYSLAQVYDRQGKYVLADPRFRLAEKIREKTQGIMSPGFADILESHSAMLKVMGHAKEAAQDATLATAIRRAHPKQQAH